MRCRLQHRTDHLLRLLSLRRVTLPDDFQATGTGSMDPHPDDLLELDRFDAGLSQRPQLLLPLQGPSRHLRRRIHPGRRSLSHLLLHRQGASCPPLHVLDLLSIHLYRLRLFRLRYLAHEGYPWPCRLAMALCSRRHLDGSRWHRDVFLSPAITDANGERLPRPEGMVQ